MSLDYPESLAYYEELQQIIRTSGRLRETDHAILARAVALVLDRPGDFSSDPVEALVSAVASIAVIDGAREQRKAL